MITVNIISETVKSVQGHGVHSAFIDMKEALEKRTDMRVLVNSKQKTDITHIHTTGPYAYTKAIQANKLVISAHLVPDSLRGSLALASVWLPAYAWYLRKFYNKADLLLANSPYTKGKLEEENITTKLEYLPLGVNRDWFKKDSQARKNIRKKIGINQQDFVVLSVGQIQPRKGVLDFMRVAAKLPDIKFVWVGGTPFGKLTEGHAELEKHIKSAPKNCMFIGEVDYKIMPEYHNIADIFFMPSHQETFGLVITEAASTGAPLLLRDLDIYQNLFAPYYEKADTIDGFVEKIVAMQSNKAQLEKKSEKLAEKYNWDTIANELVEKYKTLLS